MIADNDFYALIKRVSSGTTTLHDAGLVMRLKSKLDRDEGELSVLRQLSQAPNDKREFFYECEPRVKNRRNTVKYNTDNSAADAPTDAPTDEIHDFYALLNRIEIGTTTWDDTVTLMKMKAKSERYSGELHAYRK